jgi:hypothetical protein
MEEFTLAESVVERVGLLPSYRNNLISNMPLLRPGTEMQITKVKILFVFFVPA